jgi:hypothetical protein
LVLFVVKVCHVGIATGEDVHKPLTVHNVTYAPATVNPVTHGHVTSSPHVKGMIIIKQQPKSLSPRVVPYVY